MFALNQKHCFFFLNGIWFLNEAEINQKATHNLFDSVQSTDKADKK